MTTPMTDHIASGKSGTGGGEGEDDNVDSGNPGERQALIGASGTMGHRRFASGACDTDGALDRARGFTGPR